MPGGYEKITCSEKDVLELAGFGSRCTGNSLKERDQGWSTLIRPLPCMGMWGKIECAEKISLVFLGFTGMHHGIIPRASR